MQDIEIFEKLNEIVEETLGEQETPLTTKTKLKSISVTSFALIQLICNVEDSFDIAISNKRIRSAKTVGDVVSMIREELRKKSLN